MATVDLTSDFDRHWTQPAGWTWADVDSRPNEDQTGWIPHFRSSPDGSGYCRIVSRRTFGPDLDVYGWWRVADWRDRDGNVGVKLHTSLEDNLANNTITLGRSDGTVAWYVEDRQGWNPDTEQAGHNHSPPQDRPWQDGLNHVGVRHRFWWQQRLGDGGMAGRLWIDGHTLIDTVDPTPLLAGRVGWRLDGLVTDWAVVVACDV